MSSVFRARNGAGFWATQVGRRRAVSPKAITPVERQTPHVVWGERGLLVGKPYLRTSPHSPRIVELLGEYDLTGLTTTDIADELNLDKGLVHALVLTLVARGLVRSRGRVLTGNRSAIQWGLPKDRGARA